MEPLFVPMQLNVAVLMKLLIPTQDVKDGYDYKEMRLDNLIRGQRIISIYVEQLGDCE